MQDSLGKEYVAIKSLFVLLSRANQLVQRNSTPTPLHRLEFRVSLALVHISMSALFSAWKLKKNPLR